MNHPTPEQIAAAPVITLDGLVRVDCGDDVFIIAQGSEIVTTTRRLQEIERGAGRDAAADQIIPIIVDIS